MILIEGADLVGKTTLVNQLFNHPTLQAEGYIRSHFSRLPSGFRSPDQYLARMNHYLIQDRFHISEPFYAEVRGDIPMITALDFERLNSLMAITVIITAEPSLIQSRWREGEMYDLSQVLEVNQLFIDWLDGRAMVSWAVPKRLRHIHFMGGFDINLDNIVDRRNDCIC